MIFVTVGTHEQPFNRLVKCADELKRDGIISEEVIIQTGFSTYEPKYCKWRKLFPYSEMESYVAAARIVITHGGPSSFIMPLRIGKIPIVVPRRKKFGEHVNDHQLEFANRARDTYRNIIVVDDIGNLGEVIKNYDRIIEGMTAEVMSNNENFCREFEKIVNEMFFVK